MAKLPNAPESMVKTAANKNFSGRVWKSNVGVSLRLTLMCIQLQLHALYIDHLFVGETLPLVLLGPSFRTFLSVFCPVAQ